MLSSVNLIYRNISNKQGYKHQFNNPFNQEFQTTFYLEQYSQKPSSKALIYGKTEKERDKHKNIIESGIVRIEASIRTTNKQHKSISTKEQYVAHIQKQLNKYMFVEFPNQEAAYELKKDYENMINNNITKPSSEFMLKIQKHNGNIISTTLTEQTIKFLELCYCENFNEKLKATYTDIEINLSTATKDRTKRVVAIKGLTKHLSKQQKRFKNALKKRWNKATVPTMPTVQEEEQPKITLSQLGLSLKRQKHQNPNASLF